MMGKLEKWITQSSDTELITESDPVSLAERIAIRYESETPSILGKPVIVDRGVVLACEGDHPHVKVYAWALLHLNTGEARPLDISKAVKDCRLTAREVREAISKLVYRPNKIFTL